MEKNSVRSAGKLHQPVCSDKYPYKPWDPPYPLCGLVAMGEEPEWSPLPPNCEACERAQEYSAWQRSIPGQGQMEMDI